MKKKSKSMGSKSMSSKAEMENCACGSADCASCGGNDCGCGGSCGSCSGGGCASGGNSNWSLLKYVKLVVGLVLLASWLTPAMVSTQMAVGLFGLWMVFKSALKMYYKY